MATNAEKTAAVISDALGSDYRGKAWEKEGAARVYLTWRGKPAGHIAVASDGSLDLSAAKLGSTLYGKAEGYIVAELAK
jgi:hypothetical protein